MPGSTCRNLPSGAGSYAFRRRSTLRFAAQSPKFIGTFTLAFVGIGAIVSGAELVGVVGLHRRTGAAAAAPLYELPYLRPVAPVPPGLPETELDEPRPGAAAAS